MHDEATTHYVDMIDQTTLGHRYIKQHFNKTPKAGWQIDPFGHSAVQAYLLSVEVNNFICKICTPCWSVPFFKIKKYYIIISMLQ